MPMCKYNGMNYMAYRRTTIFGGELNLAVWWYALTPPNLKSGNILPTYDTILESTPAHGIEL